ncbi:MAG: TolC family protein [Lentimicrobium sp.]|jgi:outer membrane protein TolC|nr:TolC family protein [Lentimicrobium sp.]
MTQRHKYIQSAFQYLILAIILAVTPKLVSAQMLTEADVMAIVLENNYSIRVAQLDEKVLNNNVTPGNAGFLPQVDATAGTNNSVTNARQEYLSGQINERDNAKSGSINAGASLNWTLFNGMRMFTSYDMLKQELKAGELQTRLQIESTLSNALIVYYNIVQLNQKKAVLEKAVKLGQERVGIANDMLMLGAGSRLGLLQAEVDLNTDNSELINLQDLITEASIALNQLMARDAATKFTVEDTFKVASVMDYASLKLKMEQNNPSLLISQSDQELAQLNLKEIRGRRAPVLGVNVGYSFNDQTSESGFLKTSRTSGFNYGISASVNIFDGFNLNRQQQNARIGIEQAELEFKAYQDQLQAELLSAFTTYTNKLRMVAFEKQNLETALVNFEIAGERYRLGELSGFEFREAQKNQLLANDRLINSLYEVRLLEITLMQLSGSVLPE